MGNVVSISTPHLCDLPVEIKKRFSSVGRILPPLLSQAYLGLQKVRSIMDQLMEVQASEYPILNDICTYGTIIQERYVVQEVLGEGTFGKVVKIMHRRTRKKYALKIIKETEDQDIVEAQLEIDLLKTIGKMDPEGKSRIIGLRRSFLLGRNVCMLFNLMEISLYDYMRETSRIFTFYEIKLVGYQLLQALEFMKKIGIVHGDIKPENIMIKNSSSLEIRVIDLGSAFAIGDQPYHYFQTRYYRSPETILGMTYNNAVDMWSVGCVLCEMRLKSPLFAGRNEGEMLQKMVEVFGMLPKRLIRQARRANAFFVRLRKYHRLIDTRETHYRAGTRTLFSILNERERWRFFEWRTTEGDFRAFVQLAKKMLSYDVRKRINPANAMNNRFFKDVKKYFENEAD